MSQQSLRRFKLLGTMVPRFFMEPGTLLYIGAYVGRFSYCRELYRLRHEITVLEIWEPFLISLKESKFAPLVVHFVLGDVCDVGSDKCALPHAEYDYSFWWHGPEHVEKGEALKAVASLESITKKDVILGMPWGKFHQGAAYGNPYNEHKSSWYAGDFVGYQYAAIGPKDIPGGHLLFWKNMD